MREIEALQIARDAHAASTTYVDSNYRKQWEDALRMFQSKHPQDSKYNSESYKYRSKGFRPKTRSVIRKNEAAAAAAFFSNVDVVNVEPTNQRDPMKAMGAKLYKELLQYRLTKSIPWFLTLIGGLQDAMTVGVVCSYQYWKYQERVKSARNYIVAEDTGTPMMGFEGGALYYDEESSKILEDRPCIELRPVENIRIDRGALWTDPVNSSPYLIDMIPMYVGDVKLMAEPNRKTQEAGWDIPTDGVLLSAARNAYDQTRQAREGNREDSKDNAGNPSEFDIVWVHKNIVRRQGEDFCYYTLGTEHLLSRPVPLEKLYLHAERPYVMGSAVIETHKIYPEGLAGLGRELQKEANEISNTRRDNVLLVLQKRWKAKRGAQVDVRSLVRNVAGSVTLVNDMTDVEEINWQDVTQSSYQEQDRVNVDYDELTGNFSSGSVATNRKLNETVGGMALIAQGANTLTEYTIRTFVETWVEPVLRQLVKLEKAYESDQTIIALMGEKIDAQVTEAMFDTDIELNVNVGMGATDPIARVNKLMAGAKAFAEIAAMQAPGINILELGKEIFGFIGYRDGGRFITEEQDPKVAQLMGTVQALQQALQQAQGMLEDKGQIEEAEMKKMAIELQNTSRKVAAEIDNIQAGTLEKLAKAGVAPSLALAALGTTPETVQ